jgi:glycosyltransferase involved in cell wall biosynthesis
MCAENKIMVTVFICTYNHKDYIRQAIESVLSQKTSYKYEIVIHDDASTDGTRSIIEEYLRQYPETIKAMLNEENLYQKDRHLFELRGQELFKNWMKGKYCAILEGDDYWIDDNKLQYQIDFMESHKEYVACAHNTYKYNMYSGKKRKMYCNKDHDVTIFDVVDWKDRAFHANSLVFEREKMIDRPTFCEKMGEIGDYPMAIYLVLSGKIMYFKRVMSVYRYGVKGSFSERVNSGFYGEQKREEQHKKNYFDSLRMAMDYAGEENREYFEYKMGEGLFNRLNLQDDYPAIKKNPQCNEILMHWTRMARFRLLVRYILKVLHISWRTE